jgi:hypothetical protein
VSINPADTEFYTMFTVGLESRIGQQVKSDCAVSIKIVVELQSVAGMDWEEATVRDDVERMYEVAKWASYVLCTFCHSPPGWETIKAIISQLRHQIIDEDKVFIRGTVPHLGLPLYGRFKSCVVTPIHNFCV